jgi:hypothetical protein
MPATNIQDGTPLDSPVTHPRTIERLPDTARYRNRMTVRSSSNPDKVYTISYDNATGCWTCSCHANIFRGDCKHLREAGLKGRAFGRSPLPGTASNTTVTEARRDRKPIVRVVDEARQSGPITVERQRIGNVAVYVVKQGKSRIAFKTQREADTAAEALGNGRSWKETIKRAGGRPNAPITIQKQKEIAEALREKLAENKTDQFIESAPEEVLASLGEI